MNKLLLFSCTIFFLSNLGHTILNKSNDRTKLNFQKLISDVKKSIIVSFTFYVTWLLRLTILHRHKKKRAKQLKRLMQGGLHDHDKVDPLLLYFFGTEGLTYCLYKHSERILCITYGMCILQVNCKHLTKYATISIQTSFFGIT